MLKAAKIRLLLAISIIVAVVALVVITFLRMPSTRNDRPAKISSQKPSVDLALQGIRFTETNNGSTKWILVAERGEYDKSNTKVSLINVRLTMSSDDKAIGELVVDSSFAVYNTETRDIGLRGGVKARSSTGIRFNTESATYIAKSRVMTSKDKVWCTDGKISIEGKGMEFNIENANIRIKEDVTATVAVENR